MKIDFYKYYKCHIIMTITRSIHKKIIQLEDQINDNKKFLLTNPALLNYKKINLFSFIFLC